MWSDSTFLFTFIISGEKEWMGKMKRDLSAFSLSFLEDFVCYKRAYIYFNLRYFFLFLFNFKPIVNLQKSAQRVPICHNSQQYALLHKYDVKNQRTKYRHNAILTI